MKSGKFLAPYVVGTQDECWVVSADHRSSKPPYTRKILVGERKIELMEHRINFDRYRGGLLDSVRLERVCNSEWCVNPWHWEDCDKNRKLKAEQEFLYRMAARGVTVLENYRRSDLPVKCKCPEGHVWFPTPNNSRDHGCFYCWRGGGRPPSLFAQIDDRNGKLVVVETGIELPLTKSEGSRGVKTGRRGVRCKCDCGNFTVVAITEFTRTYGKSTKSCGCSKLFVGS